MMQTSLFFQGQNVVLSAFRDAALFCIAALPWFVGQPVSAAPCVFNSTESAKATEVIGFQGAAYSTNPTVWIATVNSSGGIGTPSMLFQVSASDTYIAAQIPAGYAFGLYQAWVQDADELQSSPVFINRARITSMEYPEIDTGRQFRLFGRNLRLAGATPTVRFVNVSGSASTPGTVCSGGDAYVATIQAPATLATGTYALYYSNGFGGSLGEIMAPVTLPVQPAGTDSFNLALPWGADFAPFANNIYNVKTDPRLERHAVGDGTTDDTLAIQGAIDAATTGTGGIPGGVVYFPAGTYNVSAFTGGNALTLKSKVVLQGSSSEATSINFVPPANTSGISGMIQAAAAASLMGVMDMTLKNTTVTGTGIGTNHLLATNVTSSNNSKLFAVRVTFDGGNWGTGALRLASTTGGYGRFLIANCVFQNLRRDGRAIQLKDYGSAPCNTKWVYLRNNSVLNFNIGLQLGGYNVIFENNTVNYDGTYYQNVLSSQPYADGDCRNRINLSGCDQTVLNNTFTHTGAPYVDGNDGENILAEDPETRIPTQGIVTAATSTTLTDATLTGSNQWTANVYAGFDVVIAEGTGKGQRRTVSGNTTNTLTLSGTTPWDVVPSTDSKYLICRLNVPRLLVKGNTIQNKRHTVSLYNGAYDAAVVSNTSTNSSDILVRSYRSIPGATDNASTCQNLLLKVLVADNMLTATASGTPSCITTQAAFLGNTRFSPGAILVEMRRNSVTSLGTTAYSAVNTSRASGYDAWHPQGDTPPYAMEGVIYDGNTAINALTAYGWILGINSDVIANDTDSGTLRTTYDLTHSDGTCVGGTGWNGGAFSFSGSNYIDLSWITFPTAMTVEGSFKTTGVNMTIFSNRNVGKAVMSITTAGKLSIWDNAFPNGSVQTSGTYNDGNWHQFAWTSDGTSENVYVDGTCRASNLNNPRTSSIGKGRLGKEDGTTPLFVGQMRGFRVWNTVRTPAQLIQFQNTQLAGDEPGLIQYWRLDETSGLIAKNGVLSDDLFEGLVGYWRLDDGTGTNAADSSLNENNGTVSSSGAAWTTGWAGSALLLDGTAGCATVQDSSSLDMTSALSVHATVRIDSISSQWNSNWRGIVSKGDPSNSFTGWEMGTYATSAAPTAIGFYFRRGAATGTLITCSGSTNLAAGKYYAVTATWNAATGNLCLYVNGQLQATATNPRALPLSTSALLIGKRASNGFFNGIVDDVKVFNRALSAQEVQELDASR